MGKSTSQVKKIMKTIAYADINVSYYCILNLQELKPYLPELLPHLKQTLVDPVPEVSNCDRKYAYVLYSKSGS